MQDFIAKLQQIELDIFRAHLISVRLKLKVI